MIYDHRRTRSRRIPQTTTACHENDKPDTDRLLALVVRVRDGNLGSRPRSRRPVM